MRFVSPILSVALASLLVSAPLTAQVSPPPDLSSPSLQVRLLDAEPGTAPAGSIAKGLRVAVNDAAGLPVQNAAVVFRTPESGPSATFKDGTHAEVAYTDAKGEARVDGIQWGNTPGAVPLRITAAKDTRHAGLLLEETLTAGAPTPSISLPAQLPESPLTPLPSSPASMPAVSSAATRKSIPSVVVEHHNSAAPSAEPGALAAASGATADLDSPDANIPVRNFSGTGPGIGDAPGVSVLSSGAASNGHHKTKWIVAIAVAAGAGAALAFVHKGGSSTSSAAAGISIGSPSISVGHP